MEEMSVLIARSQAGEKDAREVLIEKNLGLVHHIVRRFVGRGHDPEDLFQIGTIGLMKAIDKFDLKLGLQFSTYAVPMITGEIKRFLRDDGLVKVSRTIKENGMKVKLARQKLQGEEGREPTLQEISKATGLSAEDVVDILSLPLIGLVPDDENVVIATNQGEPLVGSNTLAGKAYQNICYRVLGREVPFLDFEKGISFWAKVSGIFHKG